MYLCVCAGCKIKELRAKTNTYIKTPVRGEEPVFIVTGRKEDVQRAEFEIKQQSQHFSEIRANRQQVGLFIQIKSLKYGLILNEIGPRRIILSF